MLRDKEKAMRPVELEQGQMTDNQTGTVEGEFNILPLNVPGLTAIDTRITMWNISESVYLRPFDFQLTAIDMYGKQIQCRCIYPPG